jgi:hypothetical protein
MRRSVDERWKRRRRRLKYIIYGFECESDSISLSASMRQYNAFHLKRSDIHLQPSPQRLYFKEGEPGKDGTEAGQTGKDGERTDQKEVHPRLTTSFSPGTGLFSVGFLVLSFFRLSLSLDPCPVVMPLATNVWESLQPTYIQPRHLFETSLVISNCCFSFSCFLLWTALL